MYGGGGFDGGGFGGGGFDGGAQFGGGGMGQFGGGDAFGGSQFGAAASQGGGFQVENSGPDGQAKSNYGKQSLIPVTIKQLKNAAQSPGGDANFVVDGRDLYQVTIVGLIQAAEEQATSLQFTVDDGTGSIMVKMWIDTDADESFAERRAQWKEGVIVRVVGQLRQFNHVKSIVAYGILPITDFNEYSFHFIDVVHTHLRHTKGPVPTAATSTVGGAASGMGQQGAAAMTGATSTNAGFAYGNSMSNLQELVLKYFTSHGAGADAGCSIEQVAGALSSSGVTKAQIREIVDFLSNEGHLYSTIDDDHFKSTA